MIQTLTHGLPLARRLIAAVLLLADTLAAVTLAAPAAVEAGAALEPVGAGRAQALKHLLVQDCGSCHGLRLSGGLGPPLLPESLAGKPAEFLAYTILQGRPGTAMPPWRAFLSEREALWLVGELKGGRP